MAKREKRPSGLRDVEAIPPNPWIEDVNGNKSLQHILNPDAEVGFYALDAVVLSMKSAGSILIDNTERGLVNHARALADVAGCSAIEQARAELLEPMHRQQAQAMFESFSEIRRSIGKAKQASGEDVAQFIVREDDVDYPDDDIKRVKRSHEFAAAVVDELIVDLALLDRKISQFLGRYEIAKGAGSSAEPITKWFIHHCASSCQGLTGSWVKSTDTTDFRRFLTAAWGDLKFPEPLDRIGNPKPLEDHFRDRLAKSDIFKSFRGN